MLVCEGEERHGCEGRGKYQRRVEEDQTSLGKKAILCEASRQLMFVHA